MLKQKCRLAIKGFSFLAAFMNYLVKSKYRDERVGELQKRIL